ncbi:50S ribosomal protein L35 [Candidatus Nardonella dryophthoridicola]|uniref:Large ribosomal subunit protein bL35 n=1 Tax=endosymbiont of Rhynchophorus ferrugineus TaxID=1972133 RepID=A0A2Z5T9A5_9GAMM|nr:50S ribosomal protein L35 [Candidatus Nardonella dryophthoridicola]QTJ62880.1 50S ribosomal protein L35 [Candidatus Nardonella dryophthoridicola]BBA85126.1 50S ribosomal protein L35 [endosymbiont of Rhynchophorus ferrugineus]
MYKLKTLSSAKKRFKITKNKLFKYKKSNMRHILTKKKSKYKRNMINKFYILSNTKIKSIKNSLPYYKKK